MQNSETENIPQNPAPAPPGKSKAKSRPTFIPTDEQKELVRQMAGYGIPQRKIAKFLGISRMTMRKHFRPQLEVAAIGVNHSVLHYLVHMATVGKNAAAAIFWAKPHCASACRRPANPRTAKNFRNTNLFPKVNFVNNDGERNGDW